MKIFIFLQIVRNKHCNNYFTEDVCNGFNFDRTKFFDSAPINIIGCIYDSNNTLPKTIEEKSKLLNFSKHDLHIMDALKIALNVSLEFDYDYGAYQLDPEPHGVFNHLKNGTSDFAMCTKSLSAMYNFSASYPLFYSGISILSHHQGYYTPLEKIYKYYGILMIAATIVIAIITYAVILLTKPKEYSFAAFEILRLFINNSLETKIDTLPLRIFFSVIFLYFLIIQATFQGNLSKFLTKPELKRNVEYLSDLQKKIYDKVYTTQSGELVVRDNEYVAEKIKITDFYQCIESVVKDASNVCVEDYFWVLILLRIHFSASTNEEILKPNLYLSKNFLRNNFLAYATRDDWPVKKRFNKVFMLLENAGLAKKWSDEVLVDLQSVINIVENYDFKPIDLNTVLFIFYFLIFGLICATISFFIEIRIASITKKVTKNTRRARRRFNEIQFE